MRLNINTGGRKKALTSAMSSGPHFDAALLLCTFCFLHSANAQNTAGVFGPGVTEGHSSFEYRGTFDAGNDGFAQRVHYQHSLNDDFMWRTVYATRKTESSELDFDFFQAELFWELSDNSDAWRTGFRFDLQFHDDDRANLFGLHWTNQYTFNEDWSARFIAMTSVDFGDNARDGLFVQTRASITRHLSDSFSLGAEVYNTYGTLDSPLEFSDQVHQIGPVATCLLEDHWTAYAGVLFGLTERSQDPQFRIWLTKAF